MLLILKLSISSFWQDMGIEDPEFVELVNQIEELERKLFAHPLHKVCNVMPVLALIFCFF